MPSPSPGDTELTAPGERPAEQEEEVADRLGFDVERREISEGMECIEVRTRRGVVWLCGSTFFFLFLFLFCFVLLYLLKINAKFSPVVHIRVHRGCRAGGGVENASWNSATTSYHGGVPKTFAVDHTVVE